MKKKSQGEITSTTKGQQQVQEKMADYWANIFAEEHITTTEHDIEQCIGEEANNNTLKLNDEKREEMEKLITMEDLDKVVEGLKTSKAPGTSGFTNEFYKEFHKDLKF